MTVPLWEGTSPDHSRALRMTLAEVLGGGRALRSATDLLECA